MRGAWIVVSVAVTGCERPAIVRAPEPASATVATPVSAPTVAIDRDGEPGTIASADRCPEMGENHNGFEDDDGCPELLPPALTAIEGVIAGLKFAPGKDVIVAGQEELRAIATVLRDHPGVVVEIRGHIAETGMPVYGVDWSARRARAVHNFLVAHGVEAKRLIARGYGSDRPIDTNKTAEGRARNARVELVIVER